MTTRIGRLLSALTTTALCLLAGALLAAPAGAQAAALPDGGATTTQPAEREPMLELTGIWQVDRHERAPRSDDPPLRAGDRLSAAVTVTNTTATTVSDLTLVGVGLVATCDTTTLVPDASTTCHTVAHSIDHVDAAIGAVTLAVRAEGFTDEGRLVRSAPTGIIERTAEAPADSSASTDTSTRTVAAVGVGGALAGLAALTGASAMCLTTAHRPRLRTRGRPRVRTVRW